MTISTLAFGKASAYGSHRCVAVHRLCKRSHTNSAAAVAAEDNGQHPSNGRYARSPDRHASQRELFMDVLSANATKRDAKQYLARFKRPKQVGRLGASLSEDDARHRRDQERLERSGVNLGGLYAPARAIADSPKFIHQHRPETASAVSPQGLHLALVCLRAPEALDDTTLDGLATTLSQLVKLDMGIVVVLDLASPAIDVNVRARRSAYAKEAQRLSEAIRRHSQEASRFITSTLELAEAHSEMQSGKLRVAMPELISDTLKRGGIPLVPSLAFTSTGQLVPVPVREVMAALTAQLSAPSEDASNVSSTTSLDRIIVLDQAGGIPSKARKDNAHVFINLQQEFYDIENELSDYSRSSVDGRAAEDAYEQHADNLQILNTCLAMLPSASSGLIISPEEAASSSRASEVQDTIGTGTRRQKNTLIHNLLTNKPMVSSSLPTARLALTSIMTREASSVSTAPTATLVKWGMLVSIIPPADRSLGWQRPVDGYTSLTLENDPRVDFGRLVHLIEDSFRRKLNVEHYLKRIEGRIAGLIVAGEYEGGAILTWEQPPGTSDPSRLVPYLDKFAVLQSSQGSSGVADILFQSMVRTCFPQGVCWRSRKDNPVNKWYFERAAGSWQIPNSNWTMFWTDEDLVQDARKWEDYAAVCRSVAPSWADGKKPD